MFETPDDGDAPVATFEHQVKCPNSRNLIAIVGDSLADPDRECDQKCNLLIEGLGRQPKDVMIVGDRLKKDVIRADRADGFYLRNVWVEQGAFNDVDVVETNGFKLRQLVTPYAQNYGVLTFASDHGLYEHIEAYGNGDSGIYPGSGPEGHCKRYGIEIRNVNSHHNVLGYSGTAGNGTFTHNSRFHHNNAGISDDSFASGHPGMPQDCSKWDTNAGLLEQRELLHERPRHVLQEHAVREAQARDRVPAVPGAGRLRLHPLRRQRQPDLEQRHLRQLALGRAPVLGAGRDPRRERPGQAVRHVERQPVHPATSWASAPAGRAPNGDRLLLGRAGHRQLLGRQPRRPAGRSRATRRCLPRLPGGLAVPDRRNPAKFAAEAPCAAWDPRDNPDPPGCTWFTTPPRPSAMRWGLAAIVLLAAGVGALLLLGERDGGTTQAATDTAQLQWKEKPSLILVPELPRDRILTGQLRNASLRAVDLDTERVQILDAAGHACAPPRCSPSSFSHGLYPWSMNVKGSKFERRRTGKIATIKPGQAVPLTLSWRVPQGGSEPVEVRFDGGTLALPR